MERTQNPVRAHFERLVRRFEAASSEAPPAAKDVYQTATTGDARNLPTRHRDGGWTNVTRTEAAELPLLSTETEPRSREYAFVASAAEPSPGQYRIVTTAPGFDASELDTRFFEQPTSFSGRFVEPAAGQRYGMVFDFQPV